MATSIIEHENEEQASEYLRLTLAKFNQLGLSATPVNYALFYTYVSGKDLALNEKLDQLIQDKDLDEEQAQTLFAHHICGGGEQVDGIVGPDT